MSLNTEVNFSAKLHLEGEKVDNYWTLNRVIHLRIEMIYGF